MEAASVGDASPARERAATDDDPNVAGTVAPRPCPLPPAKRRAAPSSPPMAAARATTTKGNKKNAKRQRGDDMTLWQANYPSNVVEIVKKVAASDGASADVQLAPAPAEAREVRLPGEEAAGNELNDDLYMRLLLGHYIGVKAAVKLPPQSTGKRPEVRLKLADVLRYRVGSKVSFWQTKEEEAEEEGQAGQDQGEFSNVILAGSKVEKIARSLVGMTVHAHNFLTDTWRCLVEVSLAVDPSTTSASLSPQSIKVLRMWKYFLRVTLATLYQDVGAVKALIQEAKDDSLVARNKSRGKIIAKEIDAQWKSQESLNVGVLITVLHAAVGLLNMSDVDLDSEDFDPDVRTLLTHLSRRNANTRLPRTVGELVGVLSKRIPGPVNKEDAEGGAYRLSQAVDYESKFLPTTINATSTSEPYGIVARGRDAATYNQRVPFGMNPIKRNAKGDAPKAQLEETQYPSNERNEGGCVEASATRGGKKKNARKEVFGKNASAFAWIVTHVARGGMPDIVRATVQREEDEAPKQAVARRHRGVIDEQRGALLGILRGTSPGKESLQRLLGELRAQLSVDDQLYTLELHAQEVGAGEAELSVDNDAEEDDSGTDNDYDDPAHGGMDNDNDGGDSMEVDKNRPAAATDAPAAQAVDDEDAEEEDGGMDNDNDDDGGDFMDDGMLTSATDAPAAQAIDDEDAEEEDGGTGNLKALRKRHRRQVVDLDAQDAELVAHIAAAAKNDLVAQENAALRAALNNALDAQENAALRAALNNQRVAFNTNERQLAATTALVEGQRARADAEAARADAEAARADAAERRVSALLRERSQRDSDGGVCVREGAQGMITMS